MRNDFSTEAVMTPATRSEQRCRTDGIPTSRRTRGFTLIELLVVIAIIAILMLILVPVIGIARDSARTAGSASNLRQIYSLVNNYLADTAGTYPFSGTGSGENAREWRRDVWESSYGPFTGSPPAVMDAMGGAYAEVFWCPLLVARYGQDQHPVGRGNYSINWFFRNVSWGGKERKLGHLNLVGQQEPFIAAGSVLPGSPQFGTYAHFESSAEEYGDGWKSLGYEYGRGRDRALVMYLDGSVKQIPKENALDLDPLIRNANNFE